jgi:hypothetical protein
MALPSFPGCDPGERFARSSREDCHETVSPGFAPEGLRPTRVSSHEDWSISTAHARTALAAVRHASAAGAAT